MRELERLQKLKLKQPKGLRKFIWNETDYQANSYGRFGVVETMEWWNGKLLLRVFAFKRMKNGHRTYTNIQFKEVQRKLQGHSHYLVGPVYAHMSGRAVEWDSEGFWVTNNNWEFYGYKMYSEYLIIREMNIPYCAWELENNQSGLRFIDYISMYMKYPKIELLVKLGLGHHLKGLRYLDLSKKKLEDIFKIDKRWIKDLSRLTTGDVLILRKYKDIRDFDDLRYAKSLKSHPYLRKYCKVSKLHDYLVTQEDKDIRNWHLENIFNDYLRFAEDLGLDLTRNKYLYPVNLKESHDELMLRKRALEEEVNLNKFMAQYEKFKKMIYENDDLIIKPVKTQIELKEESKVLEHCVSSYAQRIAEGETEVFFIRKKSKVDEPYVTLELKNNKIWQVRGKNNSAPSDDVKEFVRVWSKEHKLKCSY